MIRHASDNFINFCFIFNFFFDLDVKFYMDWFITSFEVFLLPKCLAKFYFVCVFITGLISKAFSSSCGLQLLKEKYYGEFMNTLFLYYLAAS